MTSQRHRRLAPQDIPAVVRQVVKRTPVTDIHTHLYPPAMGDRLLSGIEALLTYHYLIAEALRSDRQDADAFWTRATSDQAAWIWRVLFEHQSPLSEAARGVVHTLSRLGVVRDGAWTWEAVRAAARRAATPDDVERVLALAGVDQVVMTNDPFDPEERAWWWRGAEARAARFYASLRIDRLLNQPESAVAQARQQGYAVSLDRTAANRAEWQRFLSDWITQTTPVYVAWSLGADWEFPNESLRTWFLDEVVVPVLETHELALALMMGVERQVNPQLRDAGDGVVTVSLAPLEALLRTYPQIRVLATALARENQHELTVLARKFPQLMIFGCWWFLNTTSLMREITAMRVELLGPTFIPQHSDARVLEQVIYKWDLTREVLAHVLSDRYEALATAGWPVTEDAIQRDVRGLLSQNFWDFVRRSP
ncbi:MAG: glucuronate isomerase [Firmicutes bacterium]|nr:glucuronate isomerase [Bacillota bacterium]